MILSIPQAPSVPRFHRLRMLAQETRAELLKQLRIPAFVLPTLGLPVMFYLLFGIAFGAGRSAGSTPLAAYLLATYGSFAVVGAALFSVGVGIATERGQGWMLMKRATPLPMTVHFCARVLASVTFGAVAVLLLFALSAALGDVRLPTSTWVSLAATLTAGMLPFAALGLALGYLTGPNSAPGVINLIYLPLAFAGGLGIPLEMMPAGLRQVAPFTPTYHFGQLALHQLDAARPGALGPALLCLLLTTALGLAAAAWGYRRDTGLTWG